MKEKQRDSTFKYPDCLLGHSAKTGSCGMESNHKQTKKKEYIIVIGGWGARNVFISGKFKQ